MSTRPYLFLVPLAAASLLGAAAQARQPGDPPDLVPGSIVTTRYDGGSDDLLTAGLGALGLQTGPAPSFKDPLAPTAAELRRLAIYNNYRALVDTSTAGGYGRLYGPNVAADGAVTPLTVPGVGKIAGTEVLAYAFTAGGRSKITLMVQVPDSYDPAHGCIVAAPSSGSRGVYGAIATAGEWGLKHGCAVAYTDKGTGTGAHDLHNNLVDLIQGQFVDAGTAGSLSQFTAPVTAAQRAAYDAATPYRFAFKHAHSQVNPERDWGQDVLQSVEFAFYVLNNTVYPNPAGNGSQRVNKGNTIVIASSVSNGGGASLRAVEQDRERLIDGVAVSEPNVNPIFDPRFVIKQANRPTLYKHSRPLIDYITFENIYEGCAAAAPANAQAPLNLAPSLARCASLHAAGLLAATDAAGQATEAQAILNAYGFLPEQNLVQPVLWFSYVPQSISVTYANAYGRFSALDNLCGYSFAAVDAAKHPAPLAAALEAALFGTSNGIPPTGGVSLINNGADGGRGLEDRASTPDQNLDGALCLRSLVTGRNAATGALLPGPRLFQTFRVLEGVAEVLATGNLHGTPAVIVTGRSDDILPPNFASRPYFGLNKDVEGSRSQLRYYEVTNAQHLDNIIPLAPGLSSTLVPLHRYFIQAMDLMYAHLRYGAPLPESQVVHTTPRGVVAGVVPDLTVANVPPISDAPGPNAITFGGGAVNIPE